MLFRCFLAVKDRSLDALNLHNRAEVARPQNSSLRVPVKSSCKGRYSCTSNKKSLVSLYSPLLHNEEQSTENTFRCQLEEALAEV
jgi:hypothetical protein